MTLDGPRGQGAPLDVVIVSHNGRSLLRDCLDSPAVGPRDRPLRVIVVDNASTDGAPAMVRSEHPWVELVETGANLGFGRAANIGIRRGDAPFVLLLNPDTVVPAGALQACVAKLEGRPDVGVLGCKLVKRDGTLDHACKREFPTPGSALRHFVDTWLARSTLSSGYTAPDIGDDEEGTVGAVNGAFMLVRRTAAESVGLFDEDFWMYGEDLDWCYRFWQAGWKVLYWPGATVLHVKAGITGSRRRWQTNRAFHHSMWLFYRKHHAPQNSMALNAAVWLGVWSKLGASVATNSAHDVLERAAGRLR